MPFILFRDTDTEDALDVQGDNPFPVTLAPPGGALVHPTIPVGGDTVISTAAFARPADTTAYAAADAVANSTTTAQVQPLTFFGAAARPGGGGYVTGVLVTLTETAAVASAGFRLYLFTLVPTLVADNAAYTLLAADRANLVGALDVVLKSEGTNSTLAYAFDDSRRVGYVCAPGDTRLYGVVCAEAAYTPLSAAVFGVRLTLERNP